MTPWNPQVIAHRGASELEPEHTLAAYRRAIDLGTDALECDVRLSADGHLVCVHDRRVDRTSSGRGTVSTMDLSALRRLDWGSWHVPPHGVARDDADPRTDLLTLQALLEMVGACGRPVPVVVETKHPTRYGGSVERALAVLLAELGLDRPPRGASSERAAGRRRPAPSDLRAPIRVMSFSPLAVRRTRQLLPHVPVALLIERVPLAMHDGHLPRGVGIAAIDVNVLRRRPGWVRRVHRAGGPGHVWVVDDPSDVERCREAEVEGIITNRPDVVLDCLGRR